MNLLPLRVRIPSNDCIPVNGKLKLGESSRQGSEVNKLNWLNWNVILWLNFILMKSLLCGILTNLVILSSQRSYQIKNISSTTWVPTIVFPRDSRMSTNSQGRKISGLMGILDLLHRTIYSPDFGIWKIFEII